MSLVKNNNNTPPQLAERMLTWFLKDDLAEEVLGDLDEKFYAQLDKTTQFRAKVNYWYQVINYFRPFALKIFRSKYSNNIAMVQNYFKIGYRNILRNKGYSLINVGGLALAMVVALLLGLWIEDEFSFNKNHKNYDRIAQVMSHSDWGGDKLSTSRILVTGLGTEIKNNYESHFERVIMVRGRREERMLSYNNNHFVQNGYFFQPGGPQLFSLDMIYGQHEDFNALTDVLLSESLATKIFGDTNPVNQIIKVNSQSEMMVKGVYKDLPVNSTFHDASFFATLDFFLYGWSDLNVWDNFNIEVFVQLREGANISEASSVIENAFDGHTDGSRNHKLFLNPMSKWHLYSQFENGERVTTDRLKFVRLYGLIGIFVLLLACINFMNLNTARSEQRAKEIGIRKSVGSARYQLIFQFLSESSLVAAVAFIICLIISWMILPWFNQISGKDVSIPLGELWFWAFGIGFTILTGLLAGSYPALHFSSINAVRSLKGSYRTGRYASLPRKILVVFQFTISITLIVGTVIVYQQIQHTKNRPVGYSRDGLIMLPKRSEDLYGKYDVIQNELKRSGAVLEIAEANYPLTNTLGNNDGFSWPGKEAGYNPAFNTIKVNHDYGEAVGWTMLQGRNFSKDRPSDKTGVIITESARELMGIDHPVGMTITCRYDNWGSHELTVLGVIKDMVKGDPFQSAKPSFIFLSEQEMFWMFIRLNPELSTSESITKVEQVFKEITPDAPFDYKFLDEEYAAKFRSEELIGQLASFFTVLAIVISCLGLFGLASFVAAKRTKEIGIRKVLGASVSSLWKLLSKDFVLLIFLSCLIALPISYYFLDQWLSQYEYRMYISWWTLVISAVGALLLTLATVSFQSIKAALLNPVDSLRSE